MKPNKRGKFRQRVELQKPQTPEQFDTFGQPVPNYNTVGTYWAEIVPLQGREAIIAKQVYATATHRIRLLWLGYNVDVDPVDRLVRTDPVTGDVRTFGVVAVNDVETRHRVYDMMAEEIQTIEIL